MELWVWQLGDRLLWAIAGSLVGTGIELRYGWFGWLVGQLRQHDRPRLTVHRWRI